MREKRTCVFVAALWTGALLASAAVAQDGRACLRPSGCQVSIVYDAQRKILVSDTPLPVLIPGDRVEVRLAGEWNAVRDTGVWQCKWRTKKSCGLFGMGTCTVHHERDISMKGKLSEQIHLRAYLIDDRGASKPLAGLTPLQPSSPPRIITGRQRLQLAGSVNSSLSVPGQECRPKDPPPSDRIWYQVRVSIHRADEF